MAGGVETLTVRLPQLDAVSVLIEFGPDQSANALDSTDRLVVPRGFRRTRAATVLRPPNEYGESA